MKPHTNYILMGLGLAALSGLLSSRAATIWNGSLITFTQAAPYPNPGDRDQTYAKRFADSRIPGPLLRHGRHL
jgi:hypothetical protein